MTVEELEIIVSASIEPALKELKKLMPQIKQQVTEAVEVAQKSMEQIDTKKMSNRLQQAFQLVRKRIDNLKKSTQNNEIAIKVNNKEASKQISQVEKEIESLQKKINARQLKLDAINPQIDSIVDSTRKQITPDGVKPNSSAMDKVVDNALSNNKDFTALNNQAQKLYTEIEMYNQQLAEARNKMSQLRQETEQTATSQNKLSSFFSGFKGKIEQAKTSISGMKSHFYTMPKLTQNITNNIKKMGISVRQGLGHILKYAGALFGIRAIYSALRSSASAWLSSQNAEAKQLSANIEYMKYAMGSALAPVIQFVTNLVYQLMKAIQSVAYALTGVNIFAKATASSMKSVAGSAKKAKQETKKLADFDEIHNIQSDSNSDSGSVAPNMDLSQIDSKMLDWINSIKEKLEPLFEPIKKSWKKYGKPLLDSMKYAFESRLALLKTIGKSFEEVWLNGTGEKTVSTILEILTSIFNIIGNINTAFKEAWQNHGGTEIIQNMWNGFNNILDIIKITVGTFEEWTASDSFQTFANNVIEILKTLSSWFELLTAKLKGVWENGGKETFSKLLNFISKLVEAISTVLKALSPLVEFILNAVIPVIQEIIKSIGYVIDALSGVLDFIIGIFTGDWERAWNGIKDFIFGIFNAIKTFITTIINGIKTIIDKVTNIIKNIITKVFNAIKTIISNIFNSIKNIASNIWNNIKSNIVNKVNSIKDGITNAFQTAYNKITSIFRNIGNFFSGIWNTVRNTFSALGTRIGDAISGSIKSGINGVITLVERTINRAINLINGGINLINKLPIGGGIDTIAPLSLPRLAKGGIIDSPTIAMVGEYSGAKRNPEIVTPQNVMADTFRKILKETGMNNINVQGEAELKVNGKTLARATIWDFDSEAKRLGYKPILQRG